MSTALPAVLSGLDAFLTAQRSWPGPAAGGKHAGHVSLSRICIRSSVRSPEDYPGGFGLAGGYGGLWCTKLSRKPGSSPLFTKRAVSQFSHVPNANGITAESGITHPDERRGTWMCFTVAPLTHQYAVITVMRSA